MERLLGALGLRRARRDRVAVLLPDPRFPLAGSAWETRIAQAGFDVAIHEVDPRRLLDLTPVEIGDEALAVIDDMVPAPVVIGFGRTAGAVLHIAAEGASVAAAVMGGLPGDDELVDRLSPVRGPLLMVGGEADVDLPLEAFRERVQRQWHPGATDALELPGSLRHLVAGEGTDAVIDAVLTFLARRVTG